MLTGTRSDVIKKHARSKSAHVVFGRWRTRSPGCRRSQAGREVGGGRCCRSRHGVKGNAAFVAASVGSGQTRQSMRREPSARLGCQLAIAMAAVVVPTLVAAAGGAADSEGQGNSGRCSCPRLPLHGARIRGTGTDGRESRRDELGTHSQRRPLPRAIHGRYTRQGRASEIRCGTSTPLPAM